GKVLLPDRGRTQAAPSRGSQLVASIAGHQWNSGVCLMRFVQKLALTLRAIFRCRAADRELDAEFAEHLASETEDLIARGIPPAQARRRARATMGSVALLQEECRDTRGTARLEKLKQDAAYGWRVLLRNPAFSVTALLTMALAIGSTTAVFSLVDGILIRPLPFADPGRLYNASDLGMKGPFEVMRANSRLADYAGYLAPRSFSIAGREFPERIKGCQVSANYFSVLGVAPLIGQTFQLSDERPGARSVVLSYDFWIARYGGGSDAIGPSLGLGENGFSIAGVMPAAFRPPPPGGDFLGSVRLHPRAIRAYSGT